MSLLIRIRVIIIFGTTTLLERKGENGRHCLLQKKVPLCIKLCTVYIECNCKAPCTLDIAKLTAQTSHNLHQSKGISMTHLCKFLQTKVTNYSHVSNRNLVVQVLGSRLVTCSLDFPITHFLPPLLINKSATTMQIPYIKLQFMLLAIILFVSSATK